MRRVLNAAWLLLIGLAVSSFIILNVNGRIDSGNQGRQQDIDTNQFPTAEFGVTSSDPNERARWQTKSKKYNNKHAPRISESSDVIFLIEDWDTRLPAFPVARSAAVVTGEIREVRAYLSEDGTNIYSEFSIQVDEILKNDPLNTVITGGTLIAERRGGRVRFPSGKIVTSQVIYQDKAEQEFLTELRAVIVRGD
jgi:hypothetical protein